MQLGSSRSTAGDCLGRLSTRKGAHLLWWRLDLDWPLLSPVQLGGLAARLGRPSAEQRLNKRPVWRPRAPVCACGPTTDKGELEFGEAAKAGEPPDTLEGGRVCPLQTAVGPSGSSLKAEEARSWPQTVAKTTRNRSTKRETGLLAAQHRRSTKTKLEFPWKTVCAPMLHLCARSSLLVAACRLHFCSAPVSPQLRELLEWRVCVGK